MEVGALLVGKIINYDYDTFKRCEEKGYFLPGGSTIIIVANNINIDSIITCKQTSGKYELVVRLDEQENGFDDIKQQLEMKGYHVIHIAKIG